MRSPGSRTLLSTARQCSRQCRNLTDGVADLLDGQPTIRGDCMPRMCEEIRRSPWRSVGQRLDLRGDHRKAAAGVTGAGGLDGGVERQKLVCSAIALITSTTSPMRLRCGLGQFADPRHRSARPVSPPIGDPLKFLHLTSICATDRRSLIGGQKPPIACWWRPHRMPRRPLTRGRATAPPSPSRSRPKLRAGWTPWIRC